VPADPTDIEAFRADAHRMVDWMADYLAGVADRPVWAQVEPGQVRAQLPPRAPETPDTFDDLLADLDDVILPGMTHWQHPGWFAYFPSNSSPAAVLAEMAAAALAPQGMLWKTSPAVTELESHVLDWCVDLFGLPTSWRVDSGVGGGVIQASASDAVHTALVAARHAQQARDVRPERCVAYVSEQAHSSVEKGARVAGYGHVRLIGVDDAQALRPDLLVAAIASDLHAGLVPSFVCSAVGTTGTGGIDPVRAVGEIARRHGMWHHVDAAWAGPYMICEELRVHQDGLELVDSYVANPHKAMFTGMECTAFWVADRAPLIDAMSITPAYLRTAESDAGAVVDYRDWHVALGRRFRALKLWFVLRLFGAEDIRRRFRDHVRWARDLAARVEAHPRLHLVAPTVFPLVNLAHDDGPDATRRLVAACDAAGDVAVTASELHGAPYLRISVGQLYTDTRHVERVWQVIADAA
jgi:aromatic-L-amino-acid decarboxylase